MKSEAEQPARMFEVYEADGRYCGAYEADDERRAIEIEQSVTREREGLVAFRRGTTWAQRVEETTGELAREEERGGMEARSLAFWRAHNRYSAALMMSVQYERAHGGAR